MTLIYYYFHGFVAKLLWMINHVSLEPYFQLFAINKLIIKSNVAISKSKQPFTQFE